MSDEEIKTLFNVVDKLEKRIFLLEKVLASHAKCIGQLREDNNEELVIWVMSVIELAIKGSMLCTLRIRNGR